MGAEVPGPLSVMPGAAGASPEGQRQVADLARVLGLQGVGCGCEAGWGFLGQGRASIQKHAPLAALAAAPAPPGSQELHLLIQQHVDLPQRVLWMRWLLDF